MSGSVKSLQSIITDAENSINTSNKEVVKAINDLRTDLNTFYSEGESELALYVDSKKLVSTIAKPMNGQLLELQRRGSR